jgi:uncharacterized protein involved in exopolysaccharide biosynthesis
VLPIAALCAAVVVTAVCSALLVGAITATTYGGRAEILYDMPANAPLDARERGLATQRGLILSRAVLAPAATERNLSLDAVEDAVSVDLGTRNDLLYVTAGLTDRNAAVALAAAVTASYLRLDARVRAGAPDGRQRPRPRLLSAAYPLDDPLSPGPARLVAAGLVVGIALAAGLALLLVRR